MTPSAKKPSAPSPKGPKRPGKPCLVPAVLGVVLVALSPPATEAGLFRRGVKVKIAATVPACPGGNCPAPASVVAVPMPLPLPFVSASVVVPVAVPPVVKPASR